MFVVVSQTWHYLVVPGLYSAARFTILLAMSHPLVELW